jgi:predicted LPLAT superfamily acyltransferase
MSRAAHETARPAWTTEAERGSAGTIRLAVRLALLLGRPAMRLLLHPVCAYFLLTAGPSRAASRDYLARVLGRRATLADVWRHFHHFAACVLDRVFLLNDRMDLFDIAAPGPEAMQALLPAGRGCLVFGAHLGSFEVLRSLARQRADVRVSLLMYEANARMSNAVFNAINPDLGVEVIGLGRSGAMLAVADRLAAGNIVGLLADRGLDDATMLEMPFLGAPAAFPVGPFRMAALLRRPVVLMLCLYRGGNRYEVVLEPLPPAPTPEAMMRDYVARLEAHCRRAPYNWFNFYRFWR